MKICVLGATGRMGKEIIKYIISHNFILSSAVVKSGNEFNGEKISKIIPSYNGNFTFSDDLEKSIKISDIIIDFTNPELCLDAASICHKHKKLFVSGTTNLSQQDFSALKALANEIPILWSANMSIGINILEKVIENISHITSDTFDIEILDIHHRDKKDAPSGTGIMLGKAAARGRNLEFEDIVKYDRTNINKARTKNEIGFATLRGGNIAGEHKVSFLGEAESIEITHKAYDRKIFAGGAVMAANWLYKNRKNQPGLYSMQDALN